jgi:hypothetical protein
MGGVFFLLLFEIVGGKSDGSNNLLGFFRGELEPYHCSRDIEGKGRQLRKMWGNRRIFSLGL